MVKEFCIWVGTLEAARVLWNQDAPESKTEAKRIVTEAVKVVAATLGNTVAVCRKCYIHPAVVEAFEQGKLSPPKRRSSRRSLRLSPEEQQLRRLLKQHRKG